MDDIKYRLYAEAYIQMWIIMMPSLANISIFCLLGYLSQGRSIIKI